jgi:hypothetical protein
MITIRSCPPYDLRGVSPDINGAHNTRSPTLPRPWLRTAGVCGVLWLGHTTPYGEPAAERSISSPCPAGRPLRQCPHHRPRTRDVLDPQRFEA